MRTTDVIWSNLVLTALISSCISFVFPFKISGFQLLESFQIYTHKWSSVMQWLGVEDLPSDLDSNPKSAVYSLALPITWFLEVLHFLICKMKLIIVSPWHGHLLNYELLLFSHWVLSNSFVTPQTVAHQAPLSMGLSQTRAVNWVAVSFSRGSSRPRDQTPVSCIGRQALYH